MDVILKKKILNINRLFPLKKFNKKECKRYLNTFYLLKKFINFQNFLKKNLKNFDLFSLKKKKKTCFLFFGLKMKP